MARTTALWAWQLNQVHYVHEPSLHRAGRYMGGCESRRALREPRVGLLLSGWVSGLSVVMACWQTGAGLLTRERKKKMGSLALAIQ